MSPRSNIPAILCLLCAVACGFAWESAGASALQDRTSLGRIEAAEAAAPQSSQELVLLFTAETHGNLVPCSCPKSPTGGLARRVAFLRAGGGLGVPPAAVLRLDAGGFLPGTEVRLRDDPHAALALLQLLLQGLERSDFKAVVLDPGHRAFLSRSAPREYSRLEDIFLDSDPPAWRVLPWGGCRTAVLALDERLPDSTIVQAARAARREAALVVALARADTFSGRRLARLSGADLVLLSRGARPERVLREGTTVLVGCGLEGREVGELRLLRTPGRPLEVLDYRLHPMDATVAEDPQTASEVQALLSAYGSASPVQLHAGSEAGAE